MSSKEAVDSIVILMPHRFEKAEYPSDVLPREN